MEAVGVEPTSENVYLESGYMLSPRLDLAGYGAWTTLDQPAFLRFAKRAKAERFASLSFMAP